MTPDTYGYMIAGFTVILLGVILYALSLCLRGRAFKRNKSSRK
jgi:hypothetical protein